jgi:transcriptional regulator with XRE-family HTH domain
VTAAQEWIEIGERVREAREAAGMTQGRLAELVGLERTALVRVEKGERRLNAMELFRLADALGLPPTYLVAPVPAAIVSRRQALRAEPVETDRARFQLDVALEQHARDTEWLVGYGGSSRLVGGRVAAGVRWRFPAADGGTDTPSLPHGLWVRPDCWRRPGAS